MKFKTVEYVDFADEDGLQQEICDELGIQYEDFRRYHNVVGGEHKDLWHLWLWYVGVHSISNGMGYHTVVWWEGYTEDEMVERWKSEYPYEAKVEGVQWVRDFLRVIEFIIEKTENKELNVYYYW